MYELQLPQCVYPILFIPRQRSGFDVFGYGKREKVELVGDGGAGTVSAVTISHPPLCLNRATRYTHESKEAPPKGSTEDVGPQGSRSFAGHTSPLSWSGDIIPDADKCTVPLKGSTVRADYQIRLMGR